MRYYIIRTAIRMICIYKTMDAAQIMFAKLVEGELREENVDLVMCDTDEHGRVQTEVILYMYVQSTDIIQYVSSVTEVGCTTGGCTTGGCTRAESAK